MSNFKLFKDAIAQQLQIMSAGQLFKVDVSKEDLWDTYLNAFPEGTNPIYKERREYDCQCCKQFIRAAGGVVSIVNNKLVSIWDIFILDDEGTHPTFQPVANTMAHLIHAAPIRDVFVHREADIGTDHNHTMDGDASVLWNHFHFKLPARFVHPKHDIATHLGKYRSTKDVFKRGLQELKVDALDTVLELIAQNSLYRGEESKAVLLEFQKLQRDYLQLEDDERDNFAWLKCTNTGVARMRNTAMGTLLIDLSEDMDLEGAVAKFENMMSGTNYRRPTKLITKGMIEKAQKTTDELGLTDSLSRRYAVTEDITINNVIYADRSVKPAMSGNAFEQLIEETPDKVKNYDQVGEMAIQEFIDNVVPTAESIEMLFENKHAGNLMSLIAPSYADAEHMFKWGNNFSWAYNGDIADSIKERVKQAGGNVTGDFRASLSWFNSDDLDIHLIEPRGGAHISYSDKRSTTGGNLDVDMNAGGPNSRTPVENITYPNKCKMLEGEYHLFVNNYSRRETIDVGFDVEIEFGGNIVSFHCPKAVPHKANITVAKFMYTHADGIVFSESLPSTKASKEIYGIKTETLHPVTMVMNSPNHWDGEETGNKHWFFIMKGCTNEGKARGFFNEFLKPELNEHSKVFEVLGSKMKTEESDNQLSGLGFSSTQRNQVVFKVTGSFSRTIKVNF